MCDISGCFISDTRRHTQRKRFMTQTQVTPIRPEEEIGFMNIDTTDFRNMSPAEQIRHFEVEGYVVFPEILPAATIARIKSELAAAEMAPTSYSDAQTRAVTQPQWQS